MASEAILFNHSDTKAPTHPWRNFVLIGPTAVWQDIALNLLLAS
jgi:hypothetical protein